MAFNIGAIISVGGEREYNQAMNSIRQNLKYVTSEMKLVSSEFKNNEKSIDSLTRQNEVLDKVLSEQEKAVQETEAALKRLTGAGIDPTTMAYKELEANLNYARAAVFDTTNEIKINRDALEEASNATNELADKQSEGKGKSEKYRDALSNLADIVGIKIPDGVMGAVGKLSGLDEAVDGTTDNATGGFGKIIGSIGGIEPASLGAIGAVAGVGVAIAEMAVEAGLELDGLSAKLQTSLGLTDEEAKDAAGSIERVYIASADSREQAEQALASVMKLMDASGREAESYATQVININKVWGEDFSETTRTADTLMKTFGLSGQEALNLIAAGLISSADKYGDLLDVLNEYSPSFKRLGVDAGQFTSMIAAGIDAGANSADKAADVYKELFNKAADGNADFMQAVDDLGLSSESFVKRLTAGGEIAQTAVITLMERLESVRDKTEQNRIASKLLGSQWEDVGTDVPIAMAKVAGAIVDSTDASTKAVKNMIDTTGSSWSIFWKTLKSDLGSMVYGGPVGGAFVNAIKDVESAANYFSAPHYATGTLYHPGGLAVLGDGALFGTGGPELVDLPRGSRVYNNKETMRMLQSAGGDTFVFNFDGKNIKEVNDYIRMAKDARQNARAGR